MNPTVQIWTRSGAADWRDALTSEILADELERRLRPLELELRCVEPHGAGQALTRRIHAGTEPGDTRAHSIFCGEGVAVAAGLADATAIDRILTSSGAAEESWRPFDAWFAVRIPERLGDFDAEHLTRSVADVGSIVVCDMASLEALEDLGVIGDIDVLPPLTSLADNTITRDAALAQANQLRVNGALPSSSYVVIEDDPRFSLGGARQAIPPGSPVVMLPAPPGVESSLSEKLVRVGCSVTRLPGPTTEIAIPAVAAARSVVASSPSLAGLAATYGVGMTPAPTAPSVSRTVVDLERRIDQLAVRVQEGRRVSDQLATVRRRFDLVRERLVALHRAQVDRADELEKACQGQLRDLASVAQTLAMKLSELERRPDPEPGRPVSPNPTDDADAAVTQLRTERDALEQQLLATLGSRSWRYLAPLRKVAAAGRAMYRR